MVTPLNQIEMDVTIVISIGAVTEYGRETSFDQTAFVEKYKLMKPVAANY